MDMSKLLTNVTNLDKYVQVSHNVKTNYKSSRILLNMSTVLALKKIQSFEIEFFNKCTENGAAFKIFELMLLLPPSKTWSLLGKDLISLLQYWLSSLRSHLIFNNANWWLFLCVLLQFIKEIRLKTNTLSNILVEEIADIILALVTHDIPNISQKHKILCTFNLCGAECSREIRFALRSQFDGYFIKLATFLPTCGDVAFQYSIVETLIRWLLPRHDSTVRLEAAAKWFPDHVYDRNTVNIFLKRPWRNFFQDARDFLNALNTCSDLITSVICKKFTIGNVILVSDSERRQYWLDMNSATKCMSVILDPMLVKLLGDGYVVTSCETLVISDKDASEVKLRRDALEVVISVTTLEAPHMIPSSISVTGECNKSVEITICPKSDIARIGKALRSIFACKFQEEKVGFSHALRSRRGYIVKSKNIGARDSPSTISTTSLAQLHETLTGLPEFEYSKNPAGICGNPELSVVAEVSETVNRNSLNTSTSTFKNKGYGVCQKSRLCNKENELHKEQGKETKFLLPSVEKENSVSCLLVATIGSADESVINDTLERLPKSKDCNTDNVLDLLVQEAIQSEFIVNENDNAECAEENFKEIKPVEKLTDVSRTVTGNKCTVISNSTSAEESNTDIIGATQFSNVNFEKRNLRHKKNNQSNTQSPIKSFDENAVEEFFSQHFAQNRNGELIISPSLAKKINETSSESSEGFDQCRDYPNMENDVMPDLEVVECLRVMVNKICEEFDQCEKIFNENMEMTCTEADLRKNIPPEISNEIDSQLSRQENSNNGNVRNTKSVKSVTLKFKPGNKPTRGTKQRKRLGLSKLTTKTSIVKTRDIVQEDDSKNNVTDADMDCEIQKNPERIASSIRKKRKLYSPKDQKWNDVDNVSQVAPDTRQSSRSKITCYKQIEKERNDYMKKLRNRKPKNGKDGLQGQLSPRTRRNNEIFDKLKEHTNCNEKIMLADRRDMKTVTIYNFTSDSEDNDFKESKGKRSTSARNSIDVTIQNKCKEKKPNPKNKRVNRSKSKVQVKKSTRTIIDERMRDAPSHVLNASFEIPKDPEEFIINTVPNLKTEHKMEVIGDLNNSVEKVSKTKVNKKKAKTKKRPSLKKGKHVKVTNVLNESNDRTNSPLPGLEVEMITRNENRSDDSLTANMLQRLKQAYERTRRERDESDFHSELVSEYHVHSDHQQNIGSSDLMETHATRRRLVSCTATPGQSSQTEQLSPTVQLTNKHKKKSIESFKVICENSNNKKCLSNSKGAESNNSETLNISNYSAQDLKSIKTVGYSPITAHGDLDLCQNDLPPSREVLNKSVEPRNLEVDDLDQSIKDFFVQLNKEIVKESPNEHNELEFLCGKSRNSISSRVNVKTMADDDRSKSPVVSVSRLSLKDVNKWLPTGFNSESVSLGKLKSSSSRVSQDRVTTNVNKTTSKASPRSLSKRSIAATQISPIKLFDDLKPVTRRNSRTTNSSDGGTHCRHVFYKKKATTPRTETTQKHENYWLRSSRGRESSVEFVASASTKISPVKRKPTLESSQDIKKRRFEADVHSRDVSDSGMSASNLNDWFQSSEPATSRAATLDMGFKENMYNIIEKLDTTIDEIHYNTNKKFINMFVETQKRLMAKEAWRYELYRHTAKELLVDMVRLVDARFTDLNSRSEEMDKKFMQELKDQARSIISDDCRQKKVMVRLLREDMQAVIDFIDKK